VSLSRSRLADLSSALTTTFQRAARLPSIDLDAWRERIGGQLALMPQTQTRWYQADVERAILLADRGELALVSQLWRSAQTSGTVKGVLSTRTAGLVRLPKKFAGQDEHLQALTAGSGGAAARQMFDDLCPAEELAAMASDDIGVGVVVGELVPVRGRDYPRLVRHNTEHLRYQINEDRWYLNTVGGMQPITPGDGRWVLGTPGGRIAPWHAGLAFAVGKAYITGEHADAGDDNWRRKLANPARIAQAPQGATEPEHQAFWRQVMAWGYDTVFGLKPGWEVKLLESNGQGYQSFEKAIVRSERQIVIAIAGQVVTTDGGAGFSNADIHRSIRADLIQQTAGNLAYVVNTQILAPWAVGRWGDAAYNQLPTVEWDVSPPKDLKALADSYSAAGAALKALNEGLEPYGERVDIEDFKQRFGVKTILLPVTEARPVSKIDLAPTDIAAVVTVNEARASQNLPPRGDDSGQLTVVELKEQAAAARAARESQADATAEIAVADATEDGTEGVTDGT
jgi:Protein of unknown function (DUF935)